MLSSSSQVATRTKKEDDALFTNSGDSSGEESRKKLKELTDDIKQVDRDLDQLRALYELYFMGVERTEPIVNRDKVRRKIRDLRDLKIKNNGIKFKLQTLQARMISFENYWGRIKRQREAGTYHRDKARVKRRMNQREIEELRASAGQEQAKATAAKSTPKKSSRPSASSAADLTDKKLEQIYNAYSTAKKRCGQKVDVSLNDLSSKLRQQVPRLLKSSGAKQVEFKIVIKQGKAVLKAIPKG